jgi:hypothetical protein
MGKIVKKDCIHINISQCSIGSNMKTEVSKLGLGLGIQNSRSKINLECM